MLCPPVTESDATRRDGGCHVFQVEIADTPEERQQGLMFRKELPAGHGMVFLFDQPGVLKMWMKNTLIPLDMVFARQGLVVGVVENAQPHDLTPVGPDAEADTVVELPGGTVKRLGITAGWATLLPAASSQ